MQVLMRRILPVLVALALFAGTSAQGLELHEREIKAGLLYNFLKYTDFPDSGGASISLCLYGGDPFGGYLDHTKGLTVHEKPIAVRVISSAAEASECQLVYVSSRGDWGGLSSALAGKGVLTVSDFEGFASSGGMIEFSRSGDHVGALLNMDAVSAARLHVEARMLRLVTVVHAGKKG
jgi:hypothetical protein